MIINFLIIIQGIMCSIVSKNEYSEVENLLKKWNIWDYFIFPHISWAPKGEQVKKILKQCSLRPENTLFIDDNVSNLREVEFYNPNIMTALPDILDENFLNNEYLAGKNDKDHLRLKQYKVLEKRKKEEVTYFSNEDFLRDSNVVITIIEDCMPYFPRIVELIERTNQLNFTKIRLSEQDVKHILMDNNYSCACIQVKDKFGEYGVTGFYAVKNKRLEHFVFSCRIIGFGIENYIYRKLEFPEISVIEPVSVDLNKEYAKKIDWIHESIKLDMASSKIDPQESLLMIAGCDLEQACAYLDSKYSIRKEFNTIVDGREIRTSDTSQLLNAVDLTETEQRLLCENLPFFEEGISFDSQIFSGRFRTIVISVVDDYIRGIWKNKKLGYQIGYGGYYDQKVFLAKLTDDEKKYLFSNFEFIGKEDVEVFKKNLERIINLIGPSVHIILINGIDIDVSEWIGKDRVDRNKEMNAIVDEIVSEHLNVDLLDMRKIVLTKEYLPNKDNRHFSRNTYYKMATRLAEMTEENVCFKVKKYPFVQMKNFLGKYILNIKGRIKK